MTNYLKLVSIEIGNVADNIISAVFSNQIVSFDFSAGITIKVNGSVVQILSVKRLNDQRTFQYTISQSVLSTDTVTISYLALPSNLLGIDKSVKYGDYVASEYGTVSLETFVNQTVVNNIIGDDAMLSITRILTNAEIKLLPTIPVEIIPTVPNKIIVFLYGVVATNIAVDYADAGPEINFCFNDPAGGGNGNDVSNYTTDGAGINFYFLTFGNDVASLFIPIPITDPSVVDLAFTKNNSIDFKCYNSGVNLTGGDDANYYKVTAYYVLVDS